MNQKITVLTIRIVIRHAQNAIKAKPPSIGNLKQSKQDLLALLGNTTLTEEQRAEINAELAAVENLLSRLLTEVLDEPRSGGAGIKK